MAEQKCNMSVNESKDFLLKAHSEMIIELDKARSMFSQIIRFSMKIEKSQPVSIITWIINNLVGYMWFCELMIQNLLKALGSEDSALSFANRIHEQLPRIMTELRLVFDQMDLLKSLAENYHDIEDEELILTVLGAAIQSVERILPEKDKIAQEKVDTPKNIEMQLPDKPEKCVKNDGVSPDNELLQLNMNVEEGDKRNATEGKSTVDAQKHKIEESQNDRIMEEDADVPKYTVEEHAEGTSKPPN